jgi:hypothetical protein
MENTQNNSSRQKHSEDKPPSIINPDGIRNRDNIARLKQAYEGLGGS